MEIEEYYEVSKWLSNIKGSTKNYYKTAMKTYVEFTGLNPTELIDEAEEDRKKSRREQGQPEQRLADFFNWLQEEYKPKRNGENKTGISKNLSKTFIAAIRGFYRRNGFPIMTKSPKAAPKKENKKLSLTPQQVKLLADHAPTHRDRAIILFIFQGGFDVSTICSLNYSDVSRELKEDKTPMLIEVVREKEEIEYFTCVGHDSIEALKAYLNDRKRKGSDLKPNSPLFVKQGSKKLRSERITTNLIQNMLKDTALKAGIISDEDLEHSDLNPCRPHSLRASFSTILRLNGFDPLLVDFMQGHALPYNGAYLIPPPEKVRQMYAEIEPQLSVSGISPVEKKLDERLKAYRDDLSELQEENKNLKEKVDALERQWEDVLYAIKQGWDVKGKVEELEED